MTLDLQAVARAIGAAASPRPAKVTGWSVDTRTQNPGDVFFALRGPNFDGNEFVPAAIERGAAAVVVTQAHGLEVPELVVPDTLKALQSLARWARVQWGGTVV